MEQELKFIEMMGMEKVQDRGVFQDEDALECKWEC